MTKPIKVWALCFKGSPILSFVSVYKPDVWKDLLAKNPGNTTQNCKEAGYTVRPFLLTPVGESE